MQLIAKLGRSPPLAQYEGARTSELVMFDFYALLVLDDDERGPCLGVRAAEGVGQDVRMWAHRLGETLAAAAEGARNV